MENSHSEEGSQMDPALPFLLVQSCYPELVLKFCISEMQGPAVLRTVQGQIPVQETAYGQGFCAMGIVLLGFMEAQATLSPGSVLQAQSAVVPALQQQLNED